LRGDHAFFCGEDCHRRFVAIKMRFKLPLVAASNSNFSAISLSAKAAGSIPAPSNLMEPVSYSDTPEKYAEKLQDSNDATR
jgi:hypothetical protein